MRRWQVSDWTLVCMTLCCSIWISVITDIAYDAFRRNSDAYKHFDITLKLHPTKGAHDAYYEYTYICKAGHPKCEHKQKREHKGTNKILKKSVECNAKNGGNAPQPKQKDLHSTVTAYDKVHHRMLIAMRCAVHNRPFISVEDTYYKLEIEHLRAGKRGSHNRFPCVVTESNLIN